ncbi:PTS sugar transporter subunit IIB [Tannockella kyphosi]|uniref:PTS sugar transporter subunit IIB n=1 Tax=Tannockella kyphosi TaxID=2899121 RepID=UPI00201238CA|nr:hypothetical protein [Tannockella kyphosi]
MEEFLRDINLSFFYLWMKSKVSEMNPCCEEESICFEDENSNVRILFYPYHIIEFIIQDKEENETIFYMHFQLTNMAHCISLFEEMMECFEENATKPKHRILLCCSGGLTTSLFASKMQDVAWMKKISIQIDAGGIGGLYHIAKNYDLILLAPQIAYLYIDVQSHIKCKVEKMPTKYFATNRYIEMMDFTVGLLEDLQ